PGGTCVSVLGVRNRNPEVLSRYAGSYVVREFRQQQSRLLLFERLNRASTAPGQTTALRLAQAAHPQHRRWSRGRWDNPNTPDGYVLYARPAVQQRHVIAARPERCRAPVGGRAGTAGLPGRVDAEAVVPVAHVHAEPHRGPVVGAKIADAVARMHRGRAAATER